MKIFNVRFGFATNSSSSHSLIFTENSLKDKDCNDGNFGWNDFVAASDEMKLLYVSILADEVLSESIFDIPSRQVLIRYLLENENIQFYHGESEYGPELSRIDHASVYRLPVDWSGKFINIEFLKEFRDYFLQKNLAIIGGNDNYDEDYDPDSDKTFTLPVPMDNKQWVARRDRIYNYWTMFDRDNGTKVRFSFDDIKAEIPEKAFAPELLDIKITEKCPFASNTSENSCSKFCYQDSKVNGIESSGVTMYSIANSLSKLNVFEVALGGGEPTCHPDFIDILQSFRSQGIIPNFSTRDLSWLKDDSKWPKILSTCGSFAYSIRSAEDIINLHELTKNKCAKNKISVQVVLGTITKDTFEKIIIKAGEYNIRVTLLGYKNTGRGSDFIPIDYSWLISTIYKIHNSFRKKMKNNHSICFPYISIDTTIAEQFNDEIINLNVPKWMFHIYEGKFSGYIDAVKGKFGPSSFCSESEMFDLTSEGNDKYWSYKLHKKIVDIYPKF